MSDLKIVNTYDTSNKKQTTDFANNIRSTLDVQTEFDKVEVSFEWLDLMEETMRYLDNILRNPNRFIINEEEIVKVELARRITVDSIKHLARNTNLIQDIEDGEVKPSKILNINKEETYNTYENRFIYTLIQNMQLYVDLKKKENVFSSHFKEAKKMEYKAKSIVGSERVNIQLVIDSNIDAKRNPGNSKEDTIEKRIEKIESEIKMLIGTEVYRSLARAHVAKIIPPIKKTNLILKNVNFQHAVKLWDFLHETANDNAKKAKNKKNYEDTGVLREYINETFLLDYVALATLSEEKTIEEKTVVIEELTNNLIDRIVELNADLPEDKLKDVIGQKLLVSRNKKIASLSEVQNAFSTQIKRYLDNISNFKFGEY